MFFLVDFAMLQSSVLILIDNNLLFDVSSIQFDFSHIKDNTTLVPKRDKIIAK